jgi:uncharacterized BrkB/YihY/UPF0761 family membrane protein
MPVIDDKTIVQESRASRLSRSLRPAKKENEWSFKNICSMLFSIPFLLVICGFWLFLGIGTIWLVGSGVWQTVTTGTIPTSLLQLIKALVSYGCSLGVFAGLYFIWKEERKGLDKLGAIVASIILVVGVFNIVNWCHSGRGAVEYADD